MKTIMTGFLLLLLGLSSRAQDLPVHPGNTYIYDFLDELASAGILDHYPAVRPISLTFIKMALLKADHHRDKLSHRQERELDHFLSSLMLRQADTTRMQYFGLKKQAKDLGGGMLPPVVYHYQDPGFRFTIRPLASAQLWALDGEMIFHRRSGLIAQSTIGKSWAIWASLEDNHETYPLAEDGYLSPRMGGNYKRVGEGVDYSETRGGMSYAWSWGSVSLAKDHLVWGSGYHGSMIFSGRTPSFTVFKIQMNPVHWLEFNYFHGWLVSEVIDSTRTSWYSNAYGTDRREYYHGKFVAANLFTFKPWSSLNFSFGNSIIYNDIHPNPAFLIPFLFYKSVDHTLSGAGSNRVGYNAQMFFDISSWQLPKTHIYASLFIDEMSIKRMFKPHEQSNFFGMKAGFAWYGIPGGNARLIMEYTRSNPLTYRHYSPVTTYESNRYNLGHYLIDNAEEVYMALRWKPLPGASVEAAWTRARKGVDYMAAGVSRAGLPFMEEERWKSSSVKIHASYRVWHHITFFASLAKESTSGKDLSLYTPDLFRGEQLILSAGFSWNH